MSGDSPMDAIYGFLAGAKPGTNLVYHTGPGLPARPTHPVLAMRVAYNAGTVDLVQRRLRTGELAYIAVKRGSIAKVNEHGKFMPCHLSTSPIA